MSDDMWRRRQRERDDTGEFGGPLFPDDDDASAPAEGSGDDTTGRRLRFGPNDTGPLPHWTDPPTGEVPRVDPVASSTDDEDEDIDVWSSFTTESPVWRDDLADPAADPNAGYGGADPTGPVFADDFSAPTSHALAGEEASPPPPPPPTREPGRITIGTGSSGVQRPPPGATSSRRRSAQQRSGRPAGPARTSAAAPSGRRNLPAAILAGLVLAGLFMAASLWRPAAVVGLVTAILAVAAFEYLGKVTEKGYRPAVAPALAACVAAPLVAYWIGDAGLPLVLAFGFIAAAVGFISAPGVEAGPLPNMAVTSMAMVWIGLLGSFAALIVNLDHVVGGSFGTDTMFLIVLGVVANDIGALIVGSAIGKTPMREWISPSKTVEGLIGGTFLTVLALFVVGLTDRSDSWTTPDLLILAAVIVVLAPLGDLVESMFKRNLDAKDFGTVLAGHGGVLDRFDSFLFVLPVAYYVTLILRPWEQ
ncbi:MAG: phosphatidate cytidylyltransferase [Ilumatobacteraceae bacterium]